MKNTLKTLYILVIACMIVFLIIFFTQEKTNYESKESSSKTNTTNLIRIELSKNKKEQQCLEEALWFEARGDGEHSMKAVANVILNRVHSKDYPKTICDVVSQPKQFSYRNHLKPSQRLQINPKASEKLTYAKMKEHLKEWHTQGFEPVLEPSVLWYARSEVSNYWTRTKIKVQQIGSHVFYARIQSCKQTKSCSHNMKGKP